MRRTLRAGIALLVLGACALLPGCTADTPADPLAGYDSIDDLPRVTPDATAAEPSPTPAATATPSPTEPSWAELPLGTDATVTIVRPTRQPGGLLSGAADTLTLERQSSELDNTGILQANITSGAMACVFALEDGPWLYYTSGRDGRLYRRPFVAGAAIDYGATGAQAVNGDRAFNLMTSLQGDLLYINDHRQLVRLEAGQSSARTVLAEFDDMRCLTRWDDTLLFIATRDGASSVYSLASGGEPLLIIPGAKLMQLDVVNRRIVVLDDIGIAAYSLEGELIMPVVDGAITNFCYAGGDMYFTTAGSIFRIDPAGAVTAIADVQVAWLGGYGGALFYLDAGNALHRVGLDGAGDTVLGTAYNPTLLDDRIAFGTADDAGITADARY